MQSLYALFTLPKGFNMFWREPFRLDPHKAEKAVGLLVFADLGMFVTMTDLWLTHLFSALLWLVMLPVWYVFLQFDEGRQFRDFGNPLEQSWSLPACWLLLLPAYLLSINQWRSRPADIPDWAWQWWWVPVAGIAGWLIGKVFVLADKSRYDPRSLDEPAKRFFNGVIVVFVLAVLIARVLPTLFAPWTVQTGVSVGLVAGWIVLMAVDGLRYFDHLPDWMPAGIDRAYQRIRLIPERQHPLYDKENKRLL